MSRLISIASLLLVVLVADFSAADSVSLVLELEGTISRTESGFSLKVEGEADWNLELEGFPAEQADRIVRKYSNAKVWLRGTTRVRIIGNTIQLRNRTVQVDDIFSFLPGVRIQSVTLGSPAANRMRIGDVILEVNGAEVTSYDGFVKSLDKLRGQKVSLATLRGELVDVTLRKDGPPLGISGALVWTKGKRGGIPAKGTDPPKPIDPPKKITRS